ncbi:choice-of-anchor L domain-containing protein [Neobacillus sp. OS1-2]|uniref:choice-of-anchor L domain-containing protein n=1 Tax=Neobacillus sp. OS1-2 TaxID=3070680 RepID=UPI0027E096A1|nr:choice-of-anchor L domain-containing protein [Neobacillus sp. OS1-2]WML41498.1 choice-of-anchor L domain-containing protein [Neobacillus sp. OS1-2]
MKSKKKLNKAFTWVLLVTMIFSSISTHLFLFPKESLAAGGLQVTTGHTKEELVQNIVGTGIAVSDIKLTGNPQAFGMFSGDSSIVGFENGIVLSTGKAQDIAGPNISNRKSTEWNTPGDSSLSTLVGNIATKDAAILEFNFIPKGDHISFQYVFSSEEYNEYANSEYNDVFAFFVNGKNAALIPNSTTPVSINTVNGGKPYGVKANNPEYFRNNEIGTVKEAEKINTEMDGLTVVMSVSVQVTPGVKNSIKLAIADGYDSSYDSNVLIKAGSLNDREVQPGQVSLDSRKDYDVTVKRTGGSDGMAAVDWKAKDQNGTVVKYGTITFGDGETEKVITVPGTTKTVELSNPKGGATIEPGSTSKPIDQIPNVPGAPTNVTVVAGNGQATVSFTAPANGGSDITGYTVTAHPGGATSTGTSSPVTVPGLTNGTSYTFTVTATNAIGTSEASAPSAPIIPEDIIGAANKAIEQANDAENYFKHVGGEETEEVFIAVAELLTELEAALGVTPQDLPSIKEATQKLVDAVHTLNEASKIKELNNAIEAAEDAKSKAEAAKDRFNHAGGEEIEAEYKAVENTLAELEAALEANPQDLQTIKEATQKLLDTVNALNEASRVKELHNAIAAAEEAKKQAEAAKARYKNAGGGETDEEYKAVEKSLTELESALAADPQDSEAINEATKKVYGAVKALNKSSKAKELVNAIAAAEKAKKSAKISKERFSKAGGKDTDDEYMAVETALIELEVALTANPSHTKAIKDATKKVSEAVKVLNDASKAKELSNAIVAAEEAKKQAETAENRYKKAGGEETAIEYKAVEKGVTDLNAALAENPKDTKKIKEATKALTEVVKVLNESSKAKELSNAIAAAEEAKKLAETAESRYTKAGGEETATDYKAVEKAKAELEAALAENPQDTKKIKEATKALKEAAKVLNDSSKAKELSNAIAAAEEAKKQAEAAKDRYTKADGEETAVEYKAVEKGVADLNMALAEDLQDTKKIKEATKALKEAAKVLNDSSKAKELSNAIAAAEEAKKQAEAAKDRYTKADGEETAVEYKAVEKGVADLNMALAENPQDTKKIKEATKALKEAAKVLNDSSKAKELSNAIAAAEEAKKQAETAENRYKNAGGEETATDYKAVEKAMAELEAALAENPQDTKKIKEATKALKEAVKVLNESSKAKELSNAIAAAEEAKKQAETAENRYKNAGGEETATDYKAVEKAKAELEAALAENPQDTKKIKEATKVLTEAVKALNKSSKAKELSNAIAAAEEAKKQAEAAEDRYTKADGEETATDYKAVEKGVADLNAALAENPQDTKKIKDATKTLTEAVKALNESSKAKELSNAIAAAEEAKKQAETAEDRYTNAGGEETATDYKAVEKAKAELEAALAENPQETKRIKDATKTLTEAVKALNESSKAKELSNAIAAAEEAKKQAETAEDRYTKAGGEETATDYKAVEKGVADLNAALAENPQDTKKIKDATKTLTEAVKGLNESSKAKELSNAIAAAEEAKKQAETAEDRYTKAGGEETATDYKAVEKAKAELEAALAENPQDTKKIKEATKTLNEAVKALNEASKAKELSNAIAVAEEAKKQAKAAEDRYTKAGGEETTNEYKAVEKGVTDLNAALAENPLDTKKIKEATKTLAEAVKVLNESSKAKELSNAIAAAEEAKKQAETAKDRYTKANGEETATEYKAVEKDVTDLNAALAENPQDTKKIKEATKAVTETVDALNEASKAKELTNAMTAAEEVKKQGETVEDRYIHSGGKESSDVYKAVEKAAGELEKALTDNQPTIDTIHEATAALVSAITELHKEWNTMYKEQIKKEIEEAKNIQSARDILMEIAGSQLDEMGKKELYSLLANKVLDPNSPIISEKADDAEMIKQAIGNSGKSDSEKQDAYIRLAEKAIEELSKRDQPKEDEEFQVEENKEIVQLIAQVTDLLEKERLKKLHKLYVDTLSLTKDNAFTFNEHDSWESITSQFLLLPKGEYGTSITWKSNNPNVVSIDDHTAIVHRQEKDKTMILTANVSSGNKSLEKTFLLVVKSNIVGTKVFEKVKRNVNVEIGLAENTPQAIQRINLLDSTTGSISNKIDKLIVDDAIIPASTTEGVKLYLPDDQADIADELAIEMPLHIISRMAGDLEVKTDQGNLYLAATTLQKLQHNGIDLFFRIVPIRQQKEKENVIDRTKVNDLVQNAVKEVDGKGVNVLGTPREIETNYSGYETEVTIPLDDVLYEGINLDMLRVFIEHTDGEKEVVNGEIVYENGKPIGIKFLVSKFSTFTIFEIDTQADQQPADGNNPGTETPSEGGKNPGTVTPSNGAKTPETEKPSGNEPVSDNKVVAATNSQKNKAEGTLPNTSTSMYNLLLVGLLLISVGAGLLLFNRRSRKVRLMK